MSGAGIDRLDRVVAHRVGCSRSRAHDLVAQGRVRVDGEVVDRPGARVRPESVEVPERVPEATAPRPDPAVSFRVVHEDPAFVVVDKPAGLIVHPGNGPPEPTLVHGLLARYPEVARVGSDESRPGIVHRLDRGTSGLLVVARTAPAHEALTAQLARREVRRGYEALAVGAVAEAAGRVEAPIGRSPDQPTRMAVVAGGRPAATDYEVVHRYERPEPLSHLACRLETGRTHQIRVHLAAIGHPVVGDHVYGGARPAVPLDRLFLHARWLAFAHPVTGREASFAAPLPDELRTVVEGLG